MALPHIGLQVGNENVDLLSAFSIEKFDLYVEKKHLHSFKRSV